MYQLSVTADSVDGLRADIVAFLAEFGDPADAARSIPSARPNPADDSDDLRHALRQMNGRDARRFYRDIARASLDGGVLKLDDDLVKRYGKSSGQAFSGIQAGATKIMLRVVRRRVIFWDYGREGYYMARDDAQVVLEVIDN